MLNFLQLSQKCLFILGLNEDINKAHTFNVMDPSLKSILTLNSAPSFLIPFTC